jgi:hypothetical protein
MFMLFSLIMTAARETLESVLKSRAKNLQKALAELLGPPGDRTEAGQQTAAQNALNAFQQHPLIYALYQGNTITAGLGTNAPSYIPSAAFATAVMDLVKSGQKLPPDSAAAKAYEMFIQHAGESSEKVKEELAAWYDSAMDRVAGWYRRHTQWLLLVGGLVFAVALNLNAVVIAGHLSLNQTARERIVELAERSAPPGAQGQQLKVEDLDKAVRATGLPIGWGERRWHSMIDQFSYVEIVMGYLAFALAATLGAPFWFDLLSKVIAIRSTIKPQTAQSATAPPPAAPAPATQVVVTTADGASGPAPDRLTAPDKPFVYG